MFNEWLTYQEKEDFLAQLDSDGWKFSRQDKKMKFSGTEFEFVYVKKHPKDLEEFDKVKYIRVYQRKTDGLFKLEPYDTPKEKNKKVKKWKEDKDKNKNKDKDK